METSARDQFNELAFYTLSHPDTVYFIHQHVVDAFQAQTADEHTKPISLTFSLAGLYLYLEKNYTGKQVQHAHMLLSNSKKEWPRFQLPHERGAITIDNVLREMPGQQRDQMIHHWCDAVWQAYQESHEVVRTFVKAALDV